MFRYFNQNLSLKYGLAALLLAGLSSCDVSDGGGGGGAGAQAPDPVVVDFPIAFIERPVPRVDEDDDENQPVIPDDLLEPARFQAGARLIFKDRASVPAPEFIITDAAFAVEPTPNPDPDAPPPPPSEPPLYDVKDLTASADGMKLLFAMRAPEDEDANDDEQPTWNIWEYDRETEVLRRIIDSDLVAEAGQDISPAYLPDGKIIFSSTRARRSVAILLDEGKPQFSALTEALDEETFLLHVMSEDGQEIEQISYNQSHDLQPTVLSSGEIVFLRWDNYNNRNRLSLYKTNPDGSNTTLLYGYHSQNTGPNNSQGAFIKPRELPDGKVLVNLRPREFAQLGGDLVAIDTANFSDINQAINSSEASAESAQNSITSGLVLTDGSPSPFGYFNSAYPLFDGTERMLTSWSPCVVQGYKLGIFVNANRELIGNEGGFVDRNGEALAEGAAPVVIEADELGVFPCSEASIALGDTVPLADPIYGLWIFNALDGSQSPVVIAEQDMMYTEAIVLEPKPLPIHIPRPIPGTDTASELINENVGVINIKSVYDLDGVDETPNGIVAMADPAQTPADQRPARFIRIIKAVSIPDDDVFDFDLNAATGRAGGQRMKDIVGYVPVEPDGSAKFKVPADIAFALSVLDANGHRLGGDIGSRHFNWLTLRAGEEKTCNGCHTSDSEVPHGRPDAQLDPVNIGALSEAPFPNTQLRDNFGTPENPPAIGETMAEYYARINGPRSPSVNLILREEWENIDPRPATTSITYENLPDFAVRPAEVAPVSNNGCLNEWNSLCRLTINYLEHIHPLWSVARLRPDPADPTMNVDRRCTTCHSKTDADGNPQLPAPANGRQLDLSDGQSDAQDDYVIAYAELFYNDGREELRGGVVGDQLEQLVIDGVLQYEATDVDGNRVPAPANVADDPNATVTLVYENNDGVTLIPFLVPTNSNIGPILSPNGARASADFFAVFSNTHSGYLSDSELKLIAEWLDIGGQYYNNPFDAPAN